MPNLIAISLPEELFQNGKFSLPNDFAKVVNTLLKNKHTFLIMCA